MTVLDAAELRGLASTLSEPRLLADFDLLDAIADRTAGRPELLVAFCARRRLQVSGLAPLWLLAFAEAVVSKARGESSPPPKPLSGARRGR